MVDTAQQSSFKLTPAMPKTRLGLSLADRIKVIEARQMGKSMRQLATQFGCGKTQILNTLTQKDRYVHEWEVIGRNDPSIGARKRFRHSRNEDINRSLYDWYQQQIASGVRVTGPMLQTQARQYATLQEISNFRASNGWLSNFKRFYNITNSSCHLKQQSPEVTYHHYHHTTKNKEVDNHQATSLRYHEPSEFMPVNTMFDASDTQSSEFPRSIEQDPLLEENPQPVKLINNQTNHLKSQLHCLVAIHDIPKANLYKEPEDYSTRKPMADDLNKNVVASSSVVNHREHRLLQLQNADRLVRRDLGSKSMSNAYISKKKRIPMLVPILPLADNLTELASLACARGFRTLTIKDECGFRWMEIRQSVAFFREPEHGYPTHLARLIVDCGLRYFLEVLGQCVQRGSLFHNHKNYSLNYTEAASVLSAMDGKFVVCAGVGAIPDKKAGDFGLNAIQKSVIANKIYLTLPDQRYRSNQCAKWIDCRLGPKCGPCQQALIEFSTSPIDLCCSPAKRKAK